MEDKSYSTAGIMAIVVSVTFTFAWVFMLMGQVAYEIGMTERPIMVEISDYLFLAFAALAIYVMLALMRFLHDRHEFHGADPFIWASIGSHAIFFGSSFFMELSLIPDGTDISIEQMMPLTLFWMIGIVIIGIINIMIAAKLMRADRNFPDLLKGFAYITLAMGVCEVSVIFSFMTLPLVPASFICLAILFLRKPKEIEFV